MGIKECKIAVRPNCSNITLASEASAHDSTFVELVVAGTAMENAKRFCFLLSGYNGTRNVSVEGYYTHSGKLAMLKLKIIYYGILTLHRISYGHQSFPQRTDIVAYVVLIVLLVY